MTPVVTTGIDHVNAAVEDVRAVATALTEQVGLHLALPYAEYDGFATVGISVGRGVLFIDTSPVVPFLIPTDPARWRTVSFVPALEPGELSAELTSRGFGNSGPNPYEIGGETQWTNVFVPGVLPVDEMAFFTRYSAQWQAAIAAIRAEYDGGPLGVVGIGEVLVGGAVDRWQRLLAPTSGDGQVIVLDDGSRVHIVADEPMGVRAVTLQVRDLTAARAALADRGVAHEDDGMHLRIDPDLLAGLDLRIAA